MLRLASDADVHGDILNGLHRRLPEIDLVRVQDARVKRAHLTHAIGAQGPPAFYALEASMGQERLVNKT